MAEDLPQPTARRLLALAWPIVISRSAQVVVGFCDAAMVAHLGEAPLAATTTGAMKSRLPESCDDLRRRVEQARDAA